MTLPSFMKHVRTLESTGLIRTVKSGRVRSYALNRSGSPWSRTGSPSSAGSGRSAPTASNSLSST
jgi:hypothetical protein